MTTTDLTSLPALQAFLVHNLAAVRRSVHVVVDAACAIGAVYVVLSVIRATRRRLRTTALRGPPNPSFVWGVGLAVMRSPDSGAEYERWAEEYGGVYQIPWTLGDTKVVLCDPKAIAHFYGKEPWTYVATPFTKVTAERIVGSGILTAQGENHRKLRKTLTPAFSNPAIRDLTSVFYDSAYKAKNAWDSLIESDGGGSAVIEVQNWMNHISLDTIGIAGFSHDFRSLDGNPASVTEIFDSFAASDGPSIPLLLLAQAVPFLMNIPTPYWKLFERLNYTMGEISTELLTKIKKEVETGTLGEREEKSLLGLLIKDAGLQLTREEVASQAKVFLLAGYETTSISLTWALIELSRNPDFQTRLRDELLEFGTDPTYDQLPTSLPYLDAVVHETLRLHAPFLDFTRVAAEDDVIPLSKPVRTRSGKLVDHISVAKGTLLFVSAPSMNRSTALWGPDAKEFKPERWLGKDGIPAQAKEVQGHRHLLTFIDGPRTCIGKGFAIAEFKVVLSVLVKRFVFELRDGPEMQFEMVTGILPRPKVAGGEGTDVPLRVRRFE